MKDVPPPPWHVVHIIGTLSTGGTERALVNFVISADRCDFQHTVICFASRGELATVIEAAGIPVRVVRIRHRTLLVSLPRLARWLRREKVVVLHSHMYWAALWGRIAGRLGGVPIMVNTVHGPELWKNRRQVAIERWLNRWTARHIAVARDGMEIRLRRERVAQNRIVLIPNGVALPELPRSPERVRAARATLGLSADTPVCGSVGRLVVEKGYTHLLEALSLARREIPDLRWLSIGDGPLKSDLVARAEALGLQDAIIWAGLRQDVESLLPAMDLWVMSSVEEGLPVALLEAMGSACPIIATRIGGIPDAVDDGREALLVPVGDPAAMAAAMVALVRDPARAKSMGERARERASKQYSIESVARRIEQVYRDEIARAGRQR